MTIGSDVSTCFKLLLLEANPESLMAAYNAWPDADIVRLNLGRAQGVADRISRDKIQMVLCDLAGPDCKQAP